MPELIKLPKSKLPRKTSWTLTEILDTEQPELQWLIPQYLPQGFFFIAGAPKLGKSILAFQIALAIATGGETLGQKVEKGRVLYISFEDSVRRLKQRLQARRWTTRTDLLEVEETWESLNQGGWEKLKVRLSKKKYRMCIIDTFTRAFRLRNNKDSDEVAKVLAPMYELTRDGSVSIGFNDHHHKRSEFSGDPIEDIHGSIAKGGITDTAWSLQRERGKQVAHLDIVSRDMGFVSVELDFDSQALLWSPHNEVKASGNQAKILEFLKTSPEDNWVREIARQLNLDPSTVSHELKELANKGLVKPAKSSNGKLPFVVIPMSEEKIVH